MCISTTNGSIRASTSSGWWTTRSGPSATIVSSSSVTIVAISTMTSRRVVEPGHLQVHPHEHDVGHYRWHDDRREPRRGQTAFGRALAEPGVVEHVELRSRFGFMAFHGGALERQTDRIAAAAAEAAGASLYAVAHPAARPAALPVDRRAAGRSRRRSHAFLDHVEVVVTVHGYGRDGMFTSLLLGGRNRALAATLARRAGAGAARTTRSSTDLDAIPRELRGLHPDNPVNVPPHGGVQLELPPRVRGLGPRWADWDGDGFVPPAAGARRRPSPASRDRGRHRDLTRLAPSLLVVAVARSARAPAGGDDDTLQPLPIEGGTAATAPDADRADGARRRRRRHRAGCRCRPPTPAPASTTTTVAPRRPVTGTAPTSTSASISRVGDARRLLGRSSFDRYSYTGPDGRTVDAGGLRRRADRGVVAARARSPTSGCRPRTFVLAPRRRGAHARPEPGAPRPAPTRRRPQPAGRRSGSTSRDRRALGTTVAAADVAILTYSDDRPGRPASASPAAAERTSRGSGRRERSTDPGARRSMTQAAASRR